MPTDKSAERVRYLVSASRAGLGSSQIERLNRVANLRRDVLERVAELVEELGWLHFTELLREHGEELACALGAPRRRRKS
jgi:hypothetical protein